MSSSTIADGDYAPQHGNGIPGLLAGLDQAAIEEYLAVPVPENGRDAFLLPGRTSSPAYDLEALRLLVEEIWPPSPIRTRKHGRNLIHRLPVVCFLLRVCEPDHGVVHNLSAEYRRLKDDEDYREQSGFPDSLP